MRARAEARRSEVKRLTGRDQSRSHDLCDSRRAPQTFKLGNFGAPSRRPVKTIPTAVMPPRKRRALAADLDSCADFAVSAPSAYRPPRPAANPSNLSQASIETASADLRRVRAEKLPIPSPSPASTPAPDTPGASSSEPLAALDDDSHNGPDSSNLRADGDEEIQGEERTSVRAKRYMNSVSSAPCLS